MYWALGVLITASGVLAAIPAYGGDAYEPATPAPYEPSTTPVAIASGYEETTPPPRFPLESCYLNTHRFMCCNKMKLEQLMEKVFEDKAKSRDGKWAPCNYQQVAHGIQKAAQEKFGVDFETVAGPGDFASRTNFSGDYVCKIKAGPQYILAYATPSW